MPYSVKEDCVLMEDLKLIPNLTNLICVGNNNFSTSKRKFASDLNRLSKDLDIAESVVLTSKQTNNLTLLNSQKEFIDEWLERENKLRSDKQELTKYCEDIEGIIKESYDIITCVMNSFFHKHVLSNKSTKDKKLTQMGELKKGAINLLILLISEIDEHKEYSCADILNEFEKCLNNLSEKEQELRFLDVLNEYPIPTTFPRLKKIKNENLVIDEFNDGRKYKIFTQNEIDLLAYFLQIKGINNLIVKIRESIELLKPHCLDFIKIRSSYRNTYLKKYNKDPHQNHEKDSLISTQINKLQEAILSGQKVTPPVSIIEQIQRDIGTQQDNNRTKQGLPTEKKGLEKVNEEYKRE